VHSSNAHIQALFGEPPQLTLIHATYCPALKICGKRRLGAGTHLQALDGTFILAHNEPKNVLPPGVQRGPVIQGTVPGEAPAIH